MTWPSSGLVCTTGRTYGTVTVEDIFPRITEKLMGHVLSELAYHLGEPCYDGMPGALVLPANGYLSLSIKNEAKSATYKKPK